MCTLHLIEQPTFCIATALKPQKVIQASGDHPQNQAPNEGVAQAVHPHIHRNPPSLDQVDRVSTLISIQMQYLRMR